MRNSPRNETRLVKSRASSSTPWPTCSKKLLRPASGMSGCRSASTEPTSVMIRPHGLALVHQGKNNPGLHRFLFHGLQAEPSGAVQVFDPGQVHFQA